VFVFGLGFLDREAKFWLQMSKVGNGTCNVVSDPNPNVKALVPDSRTV